MYSNLIGGSWNKVFVQYCSKLKQLFCTSYTCINSSTTVQQYCIYCTVLWSLIQLLFCIHNAEKADAEQGAPRKKRPREVTFVNEETTSLLYYISYGLLLYRISYMYSSSKTTSLLYYVIYVTGKEL